MRESITTLLTKESGSIFWICLNLMRKGLGEDRIPHIMISWKNSWKKDTPTSRPRPILIPGFIPKFKTGSKARPPTFVIKDGKHEFYDFDWNPIDEAEYVKQIGAIDKNEFDYNDPNFIYNSYDKTYTVKGYRE